MAAEVKDSASTDCSSIKESEGEYLLIGSIPGHLKSSDLRTFFSQYVERDAFVCFHYRHRPETFRLRPQLARTEQQNTAREGLTLYHRSTAEPHDANTCCCVAKIRPELADEFIGHYHGKHWSLAAGRTLPQKVRIGRMTLKEDTSSVKSCEQCEVEKTVASEELLETSFGRVEVSAEEFAVQNMDVSSLIELNPPALMPQGNVGTPTATFIHLINSCRLPTKVIRKLKLEFPKSRTKRKYGAVPLDYDTECASETGDTAGEGGDEVRGEEVQTHVLQDSKGEDDTASHEGEESVPSVRRISSLRRSSRWNIAAVCMPACMICGWVGAASCDH